MFDSIDHVGVAVADLDAALTLYSDTFGMPVQHRDDTPVGKFLAKKGPGIHHTAYRCADVAVAIEECRTRGLRLIDEQPRRGIRDSLVAFVHPASTGGVLTELVQPAEGAH